MLFSGKVNTHWGTLMKTVLQNFLCFTTRAEYIGINIGGGIMTGCHNLSLDSIQEGSWQAHPLKNSITNDVPVKHSQQARGCHSVDLDLNLAHVESSQKKRKAKRLGSHQRGLDKVITVLTAGKKGSDSADMGQENLSTERFLSNAQFKLQ
ncbi:uncharacterized protein LOC128081381 isoform X2 [Tympanuchus pallidicinctus]|uniref:uncharacterized protein LOC128081379 isoform X2 n=1 Tax=Tympanuchus pallidicinctus TaxID=109042 RepID=UPI002287168C|nr:uncharacterized protein LOC128081379 isoform X2 [Tympanuchus pallidicinctus]XP_052540502.1 uncharacterized protein LOC128081381 isoform X2 [Tympanuchus pallidicinctus]